MDIRRISNDPDILWIPTNNPSHRAGSQYDDRNPLCAKIAVVVHVEVKATHIIARFTGQGARMFFE